MNTKIFISTLLIASFYNAHCMQNNPTLEDLLTQIPELNKKLEKKLEEQKKTLKDLQEQWAIIKNISGATNPELIQMEASLKNEQQRLCEMQSTIDTIKNTYFLK